MTTLIPEQRNFSTHFLGLEVFPFHSEALLRQIQELRYDVYCEECGFLEPGDYPDHRETDDHDAHSAHFTASHLSGDLAGYVRLVREDAEGNFPFQQHCTAMSDGAPLPPSSLAAEVSRLMVRATFRRRRGDLVTGISTCPGEAPPGIQRRDGSPQILLCLYREMYTHSVRTGIRYWYAAMERPLARALTAMGFSFRQIGPIADYHGPVAPHLADLRELERSLQEKNPALLAWMQEQSPKSQPDVLAAGAPPALNTRVSDLAMAT